MRIDALTGSISTWTAGTILTGSPIADATTIVSFTIVTSGWYIVAVTGSCDVAWVYRLRLVDTDGTTILKSQQFQALAGTNDPEYLPSPLILNVNQILRLVLNGAITSPTVGLQMSIFTHILSAL